MKKIITLSLLALFVMVTLVFANPICDRCGHEMTEVKTPIGQLYICRHCAKDVVIEVEIEEDTREKIDEKNRDRKERNEK